MKQQKEWLNCILQTRRIEMFQWKGEEVHKHPQTNSRNGPVPLTSHTVRTEVSLWKWRATIHAAIRWHVTVLKWMLRTWKLNFMVHDGSKRGTVLYNDFCDWGKSDRHKTFGRLTCRTKLLEVVSEEVLPSERLKRLFLFAYFPWNMREKEIRKERTLFLYACPLTHTHTHKKCGFWALSLCPDMITHNYSCPPVFYGNQ